MQRKGYSSRSLSRTKSLEDTFVSCVFSSTHSWYKPGLEVDLNQWLIEIQRATNHPAGCNEQQTARSIYNYILYNLKNTYVFDYSDIHRKKSLHIQVSHQQSLPLLSVCAFFVWVFSFWFDICLCLTCHNPNVEVIRSTGWRGMCWVSMCVSETIQSDNSPWWRAATHDQKRVGYCLENKWKQVGGN